MEEANLDNFNDHLDNYNPWSSLECCGLGSNINLNTTYLLANAVAGLILISHSNSECLLFCQYRKVVRVMTPTSNDHV